MYVLHVNGKDYKIEYRYRTLIKTDLIDRIVTASTGQADTPAEAIKNLIGLTAELLLAGLQYRHSDEFGYETDGEREEAFLRVCDLIDDYESENEGQGGFTLYNDLNAELEKNNFLSQITQMAQETAADQNATLIPLDHQQKRKKSKAAGESS